MGDPPPFHLFYATSLAGMEACMVNKLLKGRVKSGVSYVLWKSFHGPQLYQNELTKDL